MREYVLIMLNILGYAWIYLNAFCKKSAGKYPETLQGRGGFLELVRTLINILSITQEKKTPSGKILQFLHLDTYAMQLNFEWKV